ncbi:MAG: penicillin-binding protein activator [Candidatus Latescibacterota bacterium]
MRQWKRQVGVLLGMVVLIGAGIAWGQDVEQKAEALFGQGVQEYQKGHFRRARLSFQEAADLPEHSRSDAAHFMLGKTFYKLGAYANGIQTASLVLSRYPKSEYAAHAHRLIGDCHLRQEKPFEAARSYLHAWEQATDPQLKRRTMELAGALMTARLSPEEGQRLRVAFPQFGVDEVLGWLKVQRALDAEQHEDAKRWAADFLTKYPESVFASEAADVMGQITKPLPARRPLAAMQIGFLCPFTGSDRAYGEAFQRGVDLAYEQLAPELQQQIGLVFYDSKSDPIAAIEYTRRLADAGVSVIIGPIFASSALAAAAVADVKGVPLVLPTVTEDRFTAIGPHIFQLNVRPRTQGKRLAQYAVEHLGLRRFATLAGLDRYGEQMAQGFTSEIVRLGATVLAQEWYAPKTFDFRKQFERIREVGLVVDQEDRLMAIDDSLLTVADSRGWTPEEMAQKKEWIVHNLGETRKAHQDTPDELERVIAFDGVLIAGSSDEVVQIAPQLAFYRIETQLLGGNGWNSEEVPRMGGRYVEGAVFAAAYFPDDTKPEVRRFVDAYRMKYGEDPGIVTALAYDALTLVVRTFEAGAPDRKSMRDGLARTRGFEGAAGTISFSEDGRANEEVYLLKIEEGRIVAAQRMQDAISDEP